MRSCPSSAVGDLLAGLDPPAWATWSEPRRRDGARHTPSPRSSTTWLPSTRPGPVSRAASPPRTGRAGSARSCGSGGRARGPWRRRPRRPPGPAPAGRRPGSPPGAGTTAPGRTRLTPRPARAPGRWRRSGQACRPWLGTLSAGLLTASQRLDTGAPTSTGARCTVPTRKYRAGPTTSSTAAASPIQAGPLQEGAVEQERQRHPEHGQAQAGAGDGEHTATPAVAAVGEQLEHDEGHHGEDAGGEHQVLVGAGVVLDDLPVLAQDAGDHEHGVPDQAAEGGEEQEGRHRHSLDPGRDGDGCGTAGPCG